MKKVYSLLAFIALIASINTYTMDVERHPMFKTIDQFIGNLALGTSTNWDAIFALLKKLVQEGNAFTVNEYLTEDNLTLLAKAAESDNIIAAKRLLGLYKANPNGSTIRNRMTPLMIASLHGNLDIIKLLMQWGADPYIKNNNGNDSFAFAKKYYQLNPYVRNKQILNILQTYKS